MWTKHVPGRGNGRGRCEHGKFENQGDKQERAHIQLGSLRMDKGPRARKVGTVWGQTRASLAIEPICLEPGQLGGAMVGSKGGT